MCRSGQCEEEFFQFRFGHGFFVVGGLAGHAFAEAGGDDLEAGFVEGAGHCGELGDDVFAVASVFDHADHSGQLAVRSPQAVEYQCDAVFVADHCDLLMV